jgi:hypothetical protein
MEVFVWLSDALIKDVQDANVRVFYLTREVAKAWNQNRKHGEPVVFTGFYWSKDSKEGGPFKSESSCYRDAYYIIVLKTRPPSPSSFQKQQQVAEARRTLRQKNRRVA